MDKGVHVSQVSFSSIMTTRLAYFFLRGCICGQCNVFLCIIHSVDSLFNSLLYHSFNVGDVPTSSSFCNY